MKNILPIFFLFFLASDAFAGQYKLAVFLDWPKIFEARFNGYVGYEIRENPFSIEPVKNVILFYMDSGIKPDSNRKPHLAGGSKVYVQYIFEEGGRVRSFFKTKKGFEETKRMKHDDIGRPHGVEQEKIFSDEQTDNGP